MTRVVNIHPESPQPRLLAQAAEFIRDGGIVALPTDSCYALGCHLGDKEAMDRIRIIRQMDERHHLTLMVRDLSEIARPGRGDGADHRGIGQAGGGRGPIDCVPARCCGALRSVRRMRCG